MFEFEQVFPIWQSTLIPLIIIFGITLIIILTTIVLVRKELKNEKNK